MQKSKLSLLAVPIALLIGGCATAEQKLMETGAKLLTGNQLRDVFAKRPRTAQWSTGSASGTIQYSPDGTQKTQWASGGDTGTYEIRNGTICGKWKTIRNGQERCFTVYKTAASTYQTFYAGKLSSTLIFTN